MDLTNMKIQQNYRIPIVIVESLQKLKTESGNSINAMVIEALEEYLSKKTTPAKVNNTEPKIALLNEKKTEQKPETAPELTLDMSKLNLSLGDDTDGQI